MTTSVYRKPTHTDCYILFHSHLNQRTVTGVLRCMRDRANRICNPTSKQKEFQHLQPVFQANGFPAELVRKTLSHQTHLTPPQPVHGDPAEPQKIISSPYIRGLGERKERLSTPFGVKAAFKPTKTLRQTLMKVKNCIPEERWSMRFPARSATYSTLGTLRVRIGEHKQAVKRGDPRNGIAVHTDQSQHVIN